MQKIYLYKTTNQSVSYDKNNWYINDKPQEGPNNDDAQTHKEKAYAEAYRLAADDIIRYTNHFKNIAVLAAAGTSVGNGGKSRTALWESCEEEINAISHVLMSNNDNLKEKCQSIVEAKDIEEFLSLTILYEKLNGEIKGNNDSLHRRDLEKKISGACRLSLDYNTHHQDFIQKLTARKPSEPRIQLYTTNYDTLFEQAAQKMNYTIIDGFSFSYPRQFNGSNFDYDVVYRERTRIRNEESFVPNVIQIFKLHGSVDWERKGNTIYQKESTDSPCIIYPASEKYESSYEQPYFEMMSHFQSTLRKEGTLLVVVGFGFKDKHIQNIIKEAVLQNPNFHLLVVCYGMTKSNQDDKKEEMVESGITHELVPDFVTESGVITQNVTVIFSKFEDFVDNYPYNNSYDLISQINNETVRS